MSGTRAISTTSRREVLLNFFFPARQGTEIHAILTETLAPFLPGRVKDLSAPLYFFHSDSIQGCSIHYAWGRYAHHIVMSKSFMREEMKMWPEYSSRPTCGLHDTTTVCMTHRLSECDAVYISRSLLKFQTNLLPPRSEVGLFTILPWNKETSISCETLIPIYQNIRHHIP